MGGICGQATCRTEDVRKIRLGIAQMHTCSPPLIQRPVCVFGRGVFPDRRRGGNKVRGLLEISHISTLHLSLIQEPVYLAGLNLGARLLGSQM